VGALTIAVLSDCHLGAQPSDLAQGPDRCLGTAIALIEPHRPDLVVLTGDLADDASPDAYQRLREALNRLNAPTVAIPGNHDLAVPLRQAFPGDRDVALGNWRVIAIDTTIAGHEHGRVDLDALVSELGPDTGRPTLLALHHPPITTSTHPWFQLDGAGTLVAALATRSDVRCVISGHLHQAFHANLGATTYIGCSSTWYSLHHHARTYTPDNGHTGALLVHLDDDGEFDWHRLPLPSPSAPIDGSGGRRSPR
jgi:3',5'-cyclic-AMP phosphodiesterase